MHHTAPTSCSELRAVPLAHGYGVRAARAARVVRVVRVFVSIGCFSSDAPLLELEPSGDRVVRASTDGALSSSAHSMSVASSSSSDSTMFTAPGSKEVHPTIFFRYSNMNRPIVTREESTEILIINTLSCIFEFDERSTRGVGVVLLFAV